MSREDVSAPRDMSTDPVAKWAEQHGVDLAEYVQGERRAHLLRERGEPVCWCCGGTGIAASSPCEECGGSGYEAPP